MTLALICSRTAVFCVHNKLVCSWQISGLRVLQLNVGSLATGVVTDKQCGGETAARAKWDVQLTSQPPPRQEQDRAGRCLLFQLVSRLHGEKQNQTLRHGHLDIYFNICSMVSTFLFSAQTKPESHNALQCKDLSIKAIWFNKKHAKQ